MSIKYKLHCISWNIEHVKFNVFDLSGANCGQLTIKTNDVFNFVQNSWNGNIFWNDKVPQSRIG